MTMIFLSWIDASVWLFCNRETLFIDISSYAIILSNILLSWILRKKNIAVIIIKSKCILLNSILIDDICLAILNNFLINRKYYQSESDNNLVL